jgi:hypothetical protein
LRVYQKDTNEIKSQEENLNYYDNSELFAIVSEVSFKLQPVPIKEWLKKQKTFLTSETMKNQGINLNEIDPRFLKVNSISLNSNL